MAGETEAKLREALEECERLRVENMSLRALLGMPDKDSPPNAKTPRRIKSDSSTEEKIALFRSLFRGREDVYPLRWETKNGRSGYSPACVNEWDRLLCKKPRVKCSDCESRSFLPLTDEVVRGHLTGRQSVGIYPLLSDETCRFLAIDFDKSTWREDSRAYLDTCKEMMIPAVLERSRSGMGGHVWIFFDSPVPASMARRLGSAVLTRTMEKRPELGFESYDRFFPSQDTMPKGGFGNLIALPLERGPREKGNTLFVDDEFEPYSDQWALLSSIRKMRLEEVSRAIREATGNSGVIAVRMSRNDEEEEDPWTKLPSRKSRAFQEDKMEGPFPEKVLIVLGNMVYIEERGLPPAMINRLLRLAAFQNPEFYRAQAMRLSTFGKPRVISCAEDLNRHIALPRGSLKEVRELLEAHGIGVDVRDERFGGLPVEVSFEGGLRPLQKEAAGALLSHDNGILAAATAFGKTVVAAHIIAERKVNTLVLVHRRNLMDQWRERLNVFLNMPGTEIGHIGGGTLRRTGVIDVAMIQSLVRKGEVKDLVAEYGQVIVDECHHISAFSFEQVLKEAKARYVLGLTATPVRKDGHHPIIMMQCGPIRFRVDSRKEARERPFEHVVVPRHTRFGLPAGANEQGIQGIYAALAEDKCRNDLIFDDILKAVAEGRSPLVLTERAGHVEMLAERLKGFAKNVIALKGGMGKRRRRSLAEQMAGISDDEERVIVATGRYIGEGFDDRRLDTLFLAMPVSWRGTLQQYAGRLHRLHASKRVVRIYDYVDTDVPVLRRMYERRLKGYRAIGYAVQEYDERTEGS
ncbi:MAG: DEAD/DEAH box helicase family protein [Thermodesulfobacteriota bacterium]